MRELLDRWIGSLANAMRAAEVTDLASKKLTLESGCEWVRKAAHEAHNAGNKIIFIGNGGSAGIASHLAIDFSKNGGLARAGLQRPLRADLPRQRSRLRERVRQAARIPCPAGRSADRDFELRHVAEHPRRGEDGAGARLQSRDLFRLQRKQRVAAHRRRELLRPRSGQGIRLRRGRASGAVPCRARHRHGLGTSWGTGLAKPPRRRPHNYRESESNDG